MPAPNELFINREMSWLEFNQRVLDEARNPGVPILERLFFLTITASNLDEFFMVRVGGLKLLAGAGIRRRDPAGLTPSAQLRAVRIRVEQMLEDQYTCLHRELTPVLAKIGQHCLKPEALSPAQHRRLEAHFEAEILPTITPVAVAPGATFPLLTNLGLYVAFTLAPEVGTPSASQSDDPRFAILRVTPGRPRLIDLEQTSGQVWVLAEDAIAAFADRVFPGQTIREAVPFRVTRNADMAVREEYAADLADEMEKVLKARHSSGGVRLEIGGHASRALRSFLLTAMELTKADLYLVDGPLDLTGLRLLCRQEAPSECRYPPCPPQENVAVDPSKPLFEQMTHRDILLLLPFERFDPVVRLVEEAADDPDVLAIKIVLYRTSSNSPIIRALLKAAQAGKSVTAIVEIKARFDEASNIIWARHLEANGVQVVFGIKGVKTHAKICMVVRRDTDGVRRYLHFGTGNYNDTTAKLYTDVGLLTADESLGRDASAFFHAITGYSEPQNYEKIAQAPISLRDRIIELIQGETHRAREGGEGRILAKMNSLVDPAIIKALYEAAQAGVTVKLNVRGICCLRPGVPGQSENIRVVSIVDRFLEHSRVFYFESGGDAKVYISSADWMPRNLDRRIELLVPVEDRACRQRLRDMLETCLNDTTKGRLMQSDGTYTPPAGSGPTAQQVLYEQACRAAERKRTRQRTVFEPHLPAPTE